MQGRGRGMFGGTVTLSRSGICRLAAKFTEGSTPRWSPLLEFSIRAPGQAIVEMSGDDLKLKAGLELDPAVAALKAIFDRADQDKDGFVTR